MKTYQKIIASLFLLATTLWFSYDKSDAIKSPKLVPNTEYSRLFKNLGEIKDAKIIKEVRPYFGFGIIPYSSQNVGDFLVFTLYNRHKKSLSRRPPYIMDLRYIGDSRYKRIGLVEKLPKSPIYYDPFFPVTPYDVDNDGDLDLLVAWPTDTKDQPIEFLENLNQGDYANRGVIANFEKADKTAEVDLIAVDYDGDKDLDFIVTDAVLIEENKGILIENNLPQKNK